MSKRITLADEIASLERELAMRQRVYPNLRYNANSSTEREKLKEQHDHEIACTEATLARLRALLPVQSSLSI